jgi:hypothetical protein
VKESLRAISRIKNTGGVRHEGGEASSGVISGCRVVEERLKSVRFVPRAGAIVKERVETTGRVLRPAGVEEQHLKAESGVAAPGGIQIESLKTNSVLAVPVVILKRALVPSAVLLPGVASIRRRNLPRRSVTISELVDGFVRSTMGPARGHFHGLYLCPTNLIN